MLLHFHQSELWLIYTITFPVKMETPNSSAVIQWPWSQRKSTTTLAEHDCWQQDDRLCALYIKFISAILLLRGDWTGLLSMLTTQQSSVSQPNALQWHKPAVKDSLFFRRFTSVHLLICIDLLLFFISGESKLNIFGTQGLKTP